MSDQKNPIATPVELAVDPAGELTVGTQLVWKFRALIAGGALVAGDRLPSVRELSETAGVNVNTARAVYARLEREGLITTRHGLGTFVAQGTELSAEVERIAAAAVAEARLAGISARDVARSIYSSDWVGAEEPADRELPDVGREAEEAAARRELRRQIARLEAELAAYPDARADGEPTHPLLRPKAHVATFAELEATRNELMDRLKGARRDAERRGRREERSRLRREGLLGDPGHHRWERVAREDCGDPGCGEFRSVPRFGPIGVITGWWRVRISSGCP
jgi:DNA-binding transcriptional regulator YhcF (GntR family)